MDVVTTKCPAGRGVSSHFCNDNDRLIRILTQPKTEQGYSHRKGLHVSMYFTPKDPCVVANARCKSMGGNSIGNDGNDNGNNPVGDVEVEAEVESEGEGEGEVEGED